MADIQHVFFALVRSGLWEKPVHLSEWGNVDLDAIYRLANQQSVVGLVAAGLEHIEDVKVTKSQALPFMKRVFSLESRNIEMNRFVANLFWRLRNAGISSLLVKGQGIAQCYERPNWRSSGDIDLLLDKENYDKAKVYLSQNASYLGKEDSKRMHLGMTLDSWSVELHGSLRSDWLGRVNTCIDEVQEDTLRNKKIRVWTDGKEIIELPIADNDVIFIFTHILQHFFAGGIGLRQICDWCRLLWRYRDEIDKVKLKTRLEKARIVSEWEVFAALAVNYLAMPMEAMPFYHKSAVIDRKSEMLMKFILRTGDLGHNRDTSYFQKYPYFVRKYTSFMRATQDSFYRMRLFPIDSVLFYSRFVTYALRTAINSK